MSRWKNWRWECSPSCDLGSERMKRAFYEWSAIALAVTSLATIGCWGYSLSTRDTPFVLATTRFNVSFSDGAIVVTDNLRPRSARNFLSGNVEFGGPLRVDHHFRIPGFAYRHVSRGAGHSRANAMMSLLLPFIVSTLGAWYCWRGYPQAGSWAAGQKTLSVGVGTD